MIEFGLWVIFYSYFDTFGISIMKKILLTGAAGFIGWKTAEILLKKKNEVVGIDNLNDYYDVRLKKYRLNQLRKYNHFKFHKLD